MKQIIASISQSLHYEALLMKRVRLTEVQLFTAIDRCMKKKEARRGNCNKVRNKSLFFHDEKKYFYRYRYNSCFLIHMFLI